MGRALLELGFHLQGFGVVLFGQLAVNIRQVAVGCSIAGVRLKGFFQISFGFFETPFGRVKDTQVVVGLRQLRLGLGDLPECLDGLLGLTLLRLNHAFHETHLNVLRGTLTFLLDQFGGLVQLAALQRFFDGFLRRCCSLSHARLTATGPQGDVTPHGDPLAHRQGGSSPLQEFKKRHGLVNSSNLSILSVESEGLFRH